MLTSSQAQIKVKTKKDNVAGVNLPNFEAFQVLTEEQKHLDKFQFST